MEKSILEERQEGLEKLVKENTGLIWCIVKKYYGSGYDLEDLFQIGNIGFIKAAKRFKPEYGFRLSTFAVPYISGEIKKFIRDDRMIKVSRSMKKDLKISIESINEVFADNGKEEKVERIVSKADEQNRIIDKIVIDELVDKLSLRDRTIIKLRYFKEKTQDEVAKVLGISQVQVSRIEKRILENMKADL